MDFLIKFGTMQLHNLKTSIIGTPRPSICRNGIGYLLKLGSVYACTSLALTVDIESFWTEGYAGHTPNSGHELAIYVL